MYRNTSGVITSKEGHCSCRPLFNMVDIPIEDDLNLSFISYYGKDYWEVLIHKENSAFISTATLVLCNIRLDKKEKCLKLVDYLNAEDLRLAGNVLDQINLAITGKTTLLFQRNITATMRSMLITWISEIWDDFDISESVIHLSVTLIDSILLMSCDKRVEKSDKFWLTFVSTRFQLLGW